MERVETVPSGCFSIKKREAFVLKAFLGSCVGIALIDKKSHIGGLYHILLPEPPAKGAVEEPEKYASTGMPLFLESFLSLGAKKENLEAYVAGGALVGQVSMADIKLDIGGQSAEVAANFLALEEIPVKQMETGGYLSSQISLDTAKLECQIEPIVSTHTTFSSMETTAAKPDLNNVIDNIRPIPQIALKVIRMINSQKISFSTIAEEIRQDQVLTAKVLQMSNSAYFNPGKEINSIDKALIFLGEKRILLLTMSVFTELFYQQAEDGYSLVKGGLFRHAVGVAYVAEQIAFKLNNVPRDMAYTAGLLHDIGKVALDQLMAKDYPLFYRRMIEDNELSLMQIERELFGKDHCEVGYVLADRWELPATLSEVISLHHTPELAAINPNLVYTVFLANVLFEGFQSGYTIGANADDKFAQRLKNMGVTPVELVSLIDEIEWSKAELLAASGSAI